MVRSFSSRRLAGTHASVLLALLIALTAIRACIPAGFMPDMHALSQGKLALVLCPATGPIPTIPIGLSTNGTYETHDTHSTHTSSDSHAGAHSHASSVSTDSHNAHESHDHDSSYGSGDSVHPHHEQSAAAHSTTAADHHDEAAASLDCPFSLIAHQALDRAPVLSNPIALQPLRDSQATFVVLARPALPSAGPPLGSRAPPDTLS